VVSYTRTAVTTDRQVTEEKRAWTVSWRNKRKGTEHQEDVQAVDFESAVRTAKRQIALRMEGVAVADIEIYEVGEDFL
jgi:hypothetical protein